MPRHYSFITLLGLLVGLAPLAIDMYLPSLPAIAQDLATSPSAVQMTVSVYLFFYAVPQLFFGPLSDALGRRPIILFGLALYIIGSLLCALAPNVEILLAARALQATGSAAVSVTIPALVRDRYSGPDFTATMGFIMMIMSLAPMFAPLMGGVVYTFGGWRGIFIVMVAVALLATLLFHVFIAETLPQRRPFDLGRSLAQYRQLLSDRQCLFLSLSASLTFAGLMTFITASPFVYINHYGVSPQLYGVLFGINIVGTLGLTWLSNRLVYHVSSHSLLKASVGLVVCASIILLFLSFAQQPPLYVIVLACALFIANLGVLTSNVMGILMARFSRISGATSAVVGSLRFGVAAIAGAVVSIWHTADSTALTTVMAACGFLVAICFLVAGPGPDSEGVAANSQ